MSNPVVLIFIRYYLPGYKSGGPLRSISNIVEHLGDEFDFKIVTQDRDAADRAPYKNIVINQWQQVGKAQVFYVTPKQTSLAFFQKIIKNTPFDVLYLNSFFCFTFTAKPLIIRFLNKTFSQPVILAPRGEFSSAALGLKQIKKKVYLAFSSALNLYQGIVWQASSELERDDIERQTLITPKGVHIAMDLPTRINNYSVPGVNTTVASARLRILFLSRISPMKNLDYALNVLRKTKVNIIFDIYGPVDDAKYWRICQSLIRTMPRHVEVNYHGSVAHESVPFVFSQYDLFFFPTRGENYGHVIAESLAAGTPVLISNRTVWINLAKERFGWECPLENEWAFLQCIEAFSLQSDCEKEILRAHIWRCMNDWLSKKDVIEENRQLFLGQLQR